MFSPHFISFTLALGSAGLVWASQPPAAGIEQRVAVVEQGVGGLTAAFDLADINSPAVVMQAVSEANLQNIPGLGVIAEPGKPVLPAFSRFVVVPPDVGIAWEVDAGETHIIPAGEPIRAVDLGLDDRSDAFNLPIEVSGLYPQEPAAVYTPVVVRGVRLLRIDAYPLQYDGSNHTYIHHPNLQVRLRWTEDAPVNPVEYPVRRSHSKAFKKFISALAVNGPEVGRDDPDRDQPLKPGHYLIVTHENCLMHIVPFVEWRRKAGYAVDMLSLTAGDANNPDVVLEQIRNRYDAYLQRGLDPFDEILLVGDRSFYQRGPNAQWVLNASRGNSLWPNPGHADYLYGCLEGDDDFPDVGISRWISGSQATLELAVRRTLAYEAYPFFDDPAWFSRAAVYSQHWGNDANNEWRPSIHLNTRWARELARQAGFDNIAFYEQFEWDMYGYQIGPWLRDRFNQRQNLMLGQASNYYFRDQMQGVNDNVVFPIMINSASHSDFAGSIMFREGDGGHLRGVVNETFVWSDIYSTLPYNIIWLEMVRGFISLDLPWGWARTLAGTVIETYLPNFQIQGQPAAPALRTDFDACGDPGLHYWRGVPQIVRVDFWPVQNGETISTLQRNFQVRATNNDNEPLSDVNITFYAPGRLPENPAQYAQYNGFTQLSAKTDRQGLARFVVADPQFTAGADLFITATGRDIKPFFLTRRFAAPVQGVEIAEYRLVEMQGNGDDAFNPGETIGLDLDACNVGREALRNVTATVRSRSPWLRIINDDSINYGDIAAGANAEPDGVISIGVDPAAPDGAFHHYESALEVEFACGDQRWLSGLPVDIAAPALIRSRFDEVIVIPDSVSNLIFSLTNAGRSTAFPTSVWLSSLAYGVTVIRNESNFPAILAGQTGRTETPFTIAGNRIVPPGSRCPMLLMLESQNGWRDTVRFDLQVGQPRANAPQVADAGGYICFDDTDQEWDIAPEYEWIEIDPNEQQPHFNGARIDFSGNAVHNIGEARVVALGFDTQFYGQVFDRITIAANGFIAMGSQPDAVNFQNFPLERGFGGGAGMIAPFWTDLRLGQNSGVFAFYDQDQARFIIEWKRMRLAGNAQIEETFEVFLYDRRVWITESGNQDIKFQYRQVNYTSNLRQGDTQWQHGVPFPSVGISSPDGSSGVGYVWNNIYPVTSAPLQNRRAILFTTMPCWRGQNALVHGTVIDAETERGLPDVRVTAWSLPGLIGSTETDFNGQYELRFWYFEDMPTEVHFYKLGYNDTTVAVQFEIDPNRPDSVVAEVNVALPHPDFIPSLEEIRVRIAPDTVMDVPFELRNTGNGPLEWQAEKRLLDDANAAPWELRRIYWVGNGLGDDRIEGVAFDGEHFYLSGAADDQPNTIYVVDRNGELVRRFDQPGESMYGMKDLEWDGELLWGSGESHIFGFDRQGRVAREFNGPYNPNQAIAYDTDNEILWIAAMTNNINGFDRDGNFLGRVLNRRALRIYGLAFWPDDPDGYPLFILNSPGVNTLNVHKMNVENGDTLFVRQLPLLFFPGGAYITNQIDIYSWVFLAIINIPSFEGGDRLDIYQLDARKDWFDLDIWEGRLDAGETQELLLRLDSRGLPDTVFCGELLFTHNADSGETRIYVEMDIGIVDIAGKEVQAPCQFAIAGVYPNPFNSRCEVLFSIDKPGPTTLRLYDIHARETQQLWTGWTAAGLQRAAINGDKLASGIYFLQLEMNGRTQTAKVVLMR